MEQWNCGAPTGQQAVKQLHKLLLVHGCGVLLRGLQKQKPGSGRCGKGGRVLLAGNSEIKNNLGIRGTLSRTGLSLPAKEGSRD